MTDSPRPCRFGPHDLKPKPGWPEDRAPWWCERCRTIWHGPFPGQQPAAIPACVVTRLALGLEIAPAHLLRGSGSASAPPCLARQTSCQCDIALSASISLARMVASLPSDSKPGSASPSGVCAILVDYDNFYVGDPSRREQVRHRVNEMVSLGLAAAPEANWMQVRLYGGWLQDGLLTNRGSQLQAALGSDYFPRPHPLAPGLLRGDVSLVTRLIAVPRLEWGHTFRVRRGLPSLRLAEKPRPDGCAHSVSCPIDHLRRISRRSSGLCPAEACTATNADAFVVHEQKMVDTLLCCDALALAEQGSTIVVLSDDLDILPAVAMATTRATEQVVLVRSSDVAESLYRTELLELGVAQQAWTEA